MCRQTNFCRSPRVRAVFFAGQCAEWLHCRAIMIAERLRPSDLQSSAGQEDAGIAPRCPVFVASRKQQTGNGFRKTPFLFSVVGAGFCRNARPLDGGRRRGRQAYRTYRVSCPSFAVGSPPTAAQSMWLFGTKRIREQPRAGGDNRLLCGNAGRICRRDAGVATLARGWAERGRAEKGVLRLDNMDVAIGKQATARQQVVSSDLRPMS